MRTLDPELVTACAMFHSLQEPTATHSLKCVETENGTLYVVYRDGPGGGPIAALLTNALLDMLQNSEATPEPQEPDVIPFVQPAQEAKVKAKPTPTPVYPQTTPKGPPAWAKPIQYSDESGKPYSDEDDGQIFDET